MLRQVLLHFHTYLHATLRQVLLYFHIYVMLRCCKFSCTSLHTSCYAAASSLALSYIRHATLLQVLLHFHTYLHAMQTKGIKHLWRSKSEEKKSEEKMKEKVAAAVVLTEIRQKNGRPKILEKALTPSHKTVNKTVKKWNSFCGTKEIRLETRPIFSRGFDKRPTGMISPSWSINHPLMNRLRIGNN